MMMKSLECSWRRLCLAILPVSLLHAVGCGMPISVQYSAISAAQSLSPGDSSVRVYVMKFTDDRAKPEKIGAIRNALGGTAKGLVTTDDLGMILAEATTDALRKAGIDADLNLDRTANDSVPADEMKGYDSAFGGRLTEIHVESNPGWNTVKITARVVIDVCVISGGKREWIGPIDGTAERRELNQIDAQSLTLALDSALQNCMRNMVRHLKASGGVEMLKGQ